MPQLDLESLFCGGESNSKVACETAFSGSGSCSDDEGCGDAVDPYAPAESLWLRIGDDIDWSDVGAVLEREDSTKGASNPKSATRKSTSAAATWSSCAAAGAPKVVAVVIGGLPAAGKIAREHGRRRPCKLGREKVIATVAVEEEPASPKVSCLGVVRSQPGLERAKAGRRAWWACFLVAAVRRCWNPCKSNGGERDQLASLRAAEEEVQTPAVRSRVALGYGGGRRQCSAGQSRISRTSVEQTG